MKIGPKKAVFSKRLILFTYFSYYFPENHVFLPIHRRKPLKSAKSNLTAMGEKYFDKGNDFSRKYTPLYE